MTLTTDDKEWLKDNLATKKDAEKLDRKFDKLFNFLDREWSKLAKRVKKAENSLGISPPEF